MYRLSGIILHRNLNVEIISYTRRRSSWTTDCSSSSRKSEKLAKEKSCFEKFLLFSAQLRLSHSAYTTLNSLERIYLSILLEEMSINPLIISCFLSAPSCFAFDNDRDYASASQSTAEISTSKLHVSDVFNRKSNSSNFNSKGRSQRQQSRWIRVTRWLGQTERL